MQIVEVLIEYAKSSLNRPFSYCYNGPKKLKKGIRVLLDFNHRDIIGYVVKVEETSLSIDQYEEEKGFSVSEIKEVIDDEPLLNEELLSLLDEVS